MLSTCTGKEEGREEEDNTKRWCKHIRACTHREEGEKKGKRHS